MEQETQSRATLKDDAPTEKRLDDRGLQLIGLTLTVCWIGWVGWLWIDRADGFFGLGLNEIGDFFAGAFAPLAFLWLVLGFFQQGKELRNSSRALSIQADELRKSVEQQRELVKAARDQFEMNRDALAHSRAEQARIALPRLELKLSTHIQSGANSKQTFELANFGKDCTRSYLRLMEILRKMPLGTRFRAVHLRILN